MTPSPENFGCGSIWGKVFPRPTVRLRGVWRSDLSFAQVCGCSESRASYCKGFGQLTVTFLTFLILTGSAFQEGRERTVSVCATSWRAAWFFFFLNNVKSPLTQASPKTSQAAVMMMLPALLPGPFPSTIHSIITCQHISTSEQDSQQL